MTADQGHEKSDNDEIPMAEAATILELSLPVLLRKMETGELPFRLVPEERWGEDAGCPGVEEEH